MCHSRAGGNPESLIRMLIEAIHNHQTRQQDKLFNKLKNTTNCVNDYVFFVLLTTLSDPGFPPARE